MEEGFRDRAAFIRGAKDIAKEVKKHAAKKVVKGLDRVQDEYSRRSYSRFEEEDDDDDFPAPADGYYRGEGAQDEEEGGASSDATEGHDEDDEIYEGEYQGIPRAESGGKGERMADGAPLAGVRGGLGDGEGPQGGRGEAQRRKEREELAQQYEAILRECGHGRFQWTLYFVLGLALMADGVEVFVVGFVLPSAEKDMCLSDSNKGMLGKTRCAAAHPAPNSAEQFSLPEHCSCPQHCAPGDSGPKTSPGGLRVLLTCSPPPLPRPRHPPPEVGSW